MAPDIPTISIITPTFNRADELEHLINSIAKQSLNHYLFEHIIVDDGSTDNSEELISNKSSEVDFDLRYISQDNRGPGAARNAGMEEGRGELFVFIDSDCEAREDWLATIYEEYTLTGFDACGGPDASKDDFTPLQKAIDFSMTSFITTGGMRGHSDKPLAKFYPRSHNMGMTRKLYKKVGGFGGLRHGQDIELSHRIIKSGAKVAYLSDAIVYHRRRTSLLRFFKQVFNWGVARVNLSKIDKEMLEPIHVIPSLITVLGIGVIIGSTVSPNIFLPILFTGFGLLLFISASVGVRQNSLFTACLVSLIIPIQIVGYGIGFLLALMRSLVKKESWVGFSGSYYR